MQAFKLSLTGPSPMRQPDIEIYLKNTSPAKILDWLQQRFSDTEAPEQQGHSYQMRVYHDHDWITVLLVCGAAGKPWTSLWFDSPNSPWSNDLECAREIHQALEAQVRCNGGFWEEGDKENMDEWWQIALDGEESRIVWRS